MREVLIYAVLVALFCVLWDWLSPAEPLWEPSPAETPILIVRPWTESGMVVTLPQTRPSQEWVMGKDEFGHATVTLKDKVKR